MGNSNSKNVPEIPKMMLSEYPLLVNYPCSPKVFIHVPNVPNFKNAGYGRQVNIELSPIKNCGKGRTHFDKITPPVFLFRPLCLFYSREHPVAYHLFGYEAFQFSVIPFNRDMFNRVLLETVKRVEYCLVCFQVGEGLDILFRGF